MIIGVFVLLAVWVLATGVLAWKARRYYRDRTRIGWPTDIHKPELFSPEGERFRRAAVICECIGFVLLLLWIGYSKRP
jgi:hypothetical protein